MSNYFISKDNKTGEIVYLEYNKDGYKISPKAKKKDAIEVNKIVFVSPTLTQKLIKKKIDHKISKLLLEVNTTYDDDDTEEGVSRVRNQLVEAERLKLNIINNKAKYLGKAYASLTLKKLEIIINEYRNRLYTIRKINEQKLLYSLFNNFDMESDKKGRGR